MDYDNIIYPLDKIYSQATGVGCTVTPASVADNTPSHGEYGVLNVDQGGTECPYQNFYAEMQCTGPMDDNYYYQFVMTFPNAQGPSFDIFMEVDSEDNTKLVMKCDYDGQLFDGSMFDPEETGTCVAYKIDKTTWKTVETGEAEWINL